MVALYNLQNKGVANKTILSLRLAFYKITI